MHEEDKSFTIRDSKGEIVSTYFSARSKEEALRIAKKVYGLRAVSAEFTGK